MKKILVVLILLLMAGGAVFSQDEKGVGEESEAVVPVAIPVQIKDSVKKNWVEKSMEVGVTGGYGAKYGGMAGVYFRYWYLGFTANFSDWKNTDLLPKDVNDYDPPHSDWHYVPYRSILFGMTLDGVLPVSDVFGVKASVGFSEKTRKYLRRSNVTDWYYKTDRSSDVLLRQVSFGAGFVCKPVKKGVFVFGAGYLYDFGVYLQVGGTF